MAEKALIGGDAYLGSFYLAPRGLPSQLPGHFTALGDSLSGNSFAKTGKAT